MTDSAALLRRLARFRGDYSRRAYSLDAGDIELVLGMGRAYDELAEMYATMLKAYTAVRNERDELRHALEFYADPKTHEVDEANGYLPDVNWPIVDDAGERARQALKGSP